MEAICSCETSDALPSTWHYNLEDYRLHSHLRKNLTSVTSYICHAVPYISASESLFMKIFLHKIILTQEMCTIIIKDKPFITQPKYLPRATEQKLNQNLFPPPPTFPPDTPIKVTLAARLPLSPAAQKLCRCERDVITSRTCVRSRTSRRIEIVGCC
jgi:hypothetical protein